MPIQYYLWDLQHVHSINYKTLLKALSLYYDPSIHCFTLKVTVAMTYVISGTMSYLLTSYFFTFSVAFLTTLTLYLYQHKSPLVSF